MAQWGPMAARNLRRKMTASKASPTDARYLDWENFAMQFAGRVTFTALALLSCVIGP
jgi:hypothetical protein